MSEHERMLIQLGQALDRIARPHPCNEPLPNDIRATLWQLGVPCTERTPREVVVARLWARKRSLLISTQPGWGGPGVTPPSAA